MKPCEANPFCSRLSQETRELLCARCLKSTFAEGTTLVGFSERPFVILEGVVLVETDGKPTSLLVPGTVATTPKFTPERYQDLIASEESAEEQYLESRSHFLTPATFAYFSNRAVMELMDDNAFLRLLYEFDISQLNQASIFQRYLYQKPAEESIRYVLRIAKKYGLSGLTHEKIARISGRRRPTVTQVLHRIAIGEPELLDVLG